MKQKKENFFVKRSRKNKKGFSFVEVMTAVFILTVGIIAALSLFSSQLTQLLNSRNQVIAGLLAQENMEIVRNIRDNNWANNKTAFEINLPSTNSQNCIIDISH
jgi:prepilin-type N-terminal cleavage/methylation domain-containing protein